MDDRADSSVRLGWRILENTILGTSRKPRVSVLMFHRVHRERDALRPSEPDFNEFDTVIRLLATHFTVRPLREAIADAAGGDGARHSVAISFDDGYADNVEIALPILKRHGVPATFFITSGALDSGIMWNDRVLHAVRHSPNQILNLKRAGLGRLWIAENRHRINAFRRLIRSLKYREFSERNEMVAAIEEAAGAPAAPRLMMTRQQVRELAQEQSADIGGHTVTHPILARLPDREAEREIVDGKESLEALIGRKIRCFAYPNGIPDEDYSRAHVEMVRNAGFELAVSTSTGGFGPKGDIYQVPRIKPWDRRPFLLGIRMLMAARADGRRARGETSMELNRMAGGAPSST